MYHDLGLYGDVAEAYMEELADRYDVDLSGFEFNKFFPPEFAGTKMLARTLISIVPFAGYAVRRRSHYLPLTLEMINRLIHKQWKYRDSLRC